MEQKGELEILNSHIEQCLKEGFNVVGTATITKKPQHMTPVIKLVKLGLKETDNDVYPVKGGKFGLGINAIKKFIEAGRIEFDEPVGGARVDDKSNPNVVTVKAIGKRFDLDGTVKVIADEKSIDLAVREEELRKTYTQKADDEHKDWDEQKKRQFIEKNVKEVMIQKKKFVHEMALSGAQSRVVIKLLGLKSAYTKQELTKPFVIISLVPEVDMSDPMIKSMVTAHMLGIRGQLFPTAYGIPAHKGSHQQVIETAPADLPKSLCGGNCTCNHGPEKNESKDIDDYPESIRMLIETNAFVK